MNERYCIVGDDSGHEYAIPVVRRADWDVWMRLNEADAPDWALRIDGKFTFAFPSTFPNPRVIYTATEMHADDPAASDLRR